MSEPEEEKSTSLIIEKVRDKGFWEGNFFEGTSQTKPVKINNSTILPNGLTPYELMNGQMDDDNILSKYMKMS